MQRMPLLVLLTVISAGAAEPRERPRLPPVAAGNPGQAARADARSSRDPADPAGDGSFAGFLQARSRRPVGLEAVAEVAAVRTERAADRRAASAQPVAAGTSGPETTDPEVLVLPKMEVTAEKITKLRAQLAELEARQALEERLAARAAETSVLETILNPPFLRLGGYSSEASAALARKRLEVLDWVKLLTLSLDLAKTPEDRRRIQAEIDGLNEITRKW